MVTGAALPHARLQQLVAAFVDRELEPGEDSSVEEHLWTCARCRRELAVQHAIARALAVEPVPAASVRLRHNVEQIGAPETRPMRARWRSMRWQAGATAALALLCTAVGIATVRWREESARPLADIPILRDALADCRRVTGRNFPRQADLGALAQKVPFPVRPLASEGAVLFSTWPTTLAGSPAAGLAYRWRGIVVVQYSVSLAAIREQPGIGDALRAGGRYAASELGQGVVAAITGASATVLMADAPPDELARLIL